ncbi:MAG: hypothetical protein E5Y06_00790 [Mesorhizobium sp.]|uniref:hypothetical protein n=1 Tax=Mesorhizobium sp. TaxID=1871066 RepID=UPI00121B3081|nr:hypothetical protein [Mesorhizobium sp.]TIN98512.1 MAG: hypothetical protein E5Y06_00790 [Mesorhizobium sp.]TJU99101.1 MAG: hypothetical protein E5Y08_09475 [Mesorhizobium sp.]
MNNNVVSFRPQSVACTVADNAPHDPGNSEGTVLWVWRAAPHVSAPIVADKSWLSPAARARLSAPPRDTPLPDNPPADRIEQTLPDLVQAIAARQMAPRDISEHLKKLPPVDHVERTLSMLVPATCLSLPWISFVRDNASKERMSCVQEILSVGNPAGTVAASGPHIEDAKTLSRTELRKRYKREYSSWQNMKTRCGNEGNPVHPRFEEFPNFLIEVGPKPGEEYSLDRILSGKQGGLYEPSNVHWATPEEQAINRVGTIPLTHGGITKPLPVWAKETGQDSGTLRHRRQRGWSDSEVIFGKGGGGPLNEQRPWDQHEDAEQRGETEQFYRGYKLPGETPIRFCIRYFSLGMDKWDSLLGDLGFYHVGEDDPTSAIAAHCLPALHEAQHMLRRLAPAKRWLEQIGAELKSAAETADKAKSRRSSRSTKNYRRHDREAEYLNECESNPELAHRD